VQFIEKVIIITCKVKKKLNRSDIMKKVSKRIRIAGLEKVYSITIIIGHSILVPILDLKLTSYLRYASKSLNCKLFLGH